MLTDARDSAHSLVATDCEQLGQQIRDVLVHGGLHCPAQCQVSLELAAERAGRLGSRLVVLTISPDPEKALAALSEITRVAQTHVLVVGPAGDHQLILRALHQRAAEFLDEKKLKDDLLAAIVRFKARHLAQPNLRSPGSVVAVIAPSGGSGSSTIAANVATILAQKHETTALLDLRLSAGDLASLLDLSPSYTLADLCERLDRLDRTMFEQLLTPHASGVHLLAAPRSFAQLEKVTTNGIRQAVAMARSQFPYVVLDMDSTLDEEGFDTLWQSDVILLVLRLDYTSLRNTRRMLERLEEIGLGVDRVKLVVNRYGEAKQLSIAEAEAALGMKISHYVPNDPSKMNRAINSGVPVVLQRSWARVSRSLGRLAHSVNGRHPS